MFLADFGGRDVVRKLNKNLSDLVEKGGKLNEGAKLINMSTGNTGKYIQGDLRSVNPFSQLKTSPKVKRAIIHNHPTNTSLSYSDLKPRDFISQTFAVTPDGSRFRGYVKDVEKYKSLKDNYPRIYHSLDRNFVIIYQIFHAQIHNLLLHTKLCVVYMLKVLYIIVLNFHHKIENFITNIKTLLKKYK